jgi:hypothetical protein
MKRSKRSYFILLPFYLSCGTLVGRAGHSTFIRKLLVFNDKQFSILRHGPILLLSGYVPDFTHLATVINRNQAVSIRKVFRMATILLLNTHHICTRTSPERTATKLRLIQSGKNKDFFNNIKN